MASSEESDSESTSEDSLSEEESTSEGKYLSITRTQWVFEIEKSLPISP